MKTTTLALTLPFLVLSAACGEPNSTESSKASGSGGSTSASGGVSSTAGSGGSATAGSSAGGTTSSAGTSSTGGGSGTGGGGIQVGGVDCPTDLGLSSAALLNNVVGKINGKNVRISLDPLGDAHDYRVYVLPKSGEVSGDAIQNATYRCAGEYEVPSPLNDDEVDTQSSAVRTRVGSSVQGYARTVDEATLGYVFTTPGPDRVPVYAMGDSALKADNVDCYFMRWPENRVKKYVTSEDERTTLLDQHWRDDGIAFYAPATGTANSQVIYRADTPDSDFDGPLYMPMGAEYNQRMGEGKPIEEAFSAYTTQEAGSEPLMRVYYAEVCNRGHDELVAGVARFNKAFHQGAQPIPELHYSGLDAETTLVVEAVDQLCPFRGILASMSRPAHDENSITYPTFMTADEIRALSPAGELFINGQGAEATPHALARACITVSPETPPEMDWRYEPSAETYTDPVLETFQSWTFDSPSFNVEFNTIATDVWSIGAQFGELWVGYADNAADTNGKFRIMPKTKASLADDTFIHSTMEVDMVSSDRRYPQMFISNQDWPLQSNLENGTSVLVQTRHGITSPVEAQIQFCDHRTWDVNNQCPQYETYKLNNGEFISPRPEMNGLMGVDRTVQFDVYTSTKRVYVFTNGMPYACADLPDGALTAGNATVTFGDVLYHSGVDLAAWYKFHVDKLQIVTTRHFSNLAFSSNVATPSWNESRMPCSPASTMK